MAQLTQDEKITLHNLFRKMDRQDIEHTVGLVKIYRSRMAEDEASQFAIGNIVTFTHKRSTLTGLVTKVNQKSVKVHVKRGNLTQDWKVHPSFLTISK
tara:strand:+ start:236 stop:529 length:294 start_codon:yes stop_codon:yes gene_type:complete